VMGALAGALPDKVIAPGADALWDTHIAGEGPDGRYFSFTWFSCGGTGALARKDGLNATAFPSGIAGVPVEVIETLSPVVVRRRELRQDSGGAGTFRGGLGQIMEFGVRTEKPYQFAGLYERIDFPPPPLAGGEPGEAGHLRTNNQAPLRAKETTMLPPDTVVTIEIPGGGGYGSPLQRAPEAVLADVRDGYVTIEAARERYGVVIDSASWAIDDAATRARRTRP
jgi:N-methylhydantoinase B